MFESDVFRALGDPTRRAVYERLTGGERSVGELTAGMGVSQPAVSQHLAALKAAGLVGERREGRKVFYRIEPQGLAPAEPRDARQGRAPAWQGRGPRERPGGHGW